MVKAEREKSSGCDVGRCGATRLGVGGEGMAMLSRAGERLSWQRWFHQPGVVESSAMPLMGEDGGRGGDGWELRMWVGGEDGGGATQHGVPTSDVRDV